MGPFAEPPHCTSTLHLAREGLCQGVDVPHLEELSTHPHLQSTLGSEQQERRKSYR